MVTRADVAEARGMQLVRSWEEQSRAAALTDVSAGLDARVVAFLGDRGRDVGEMRTASADFISTAAVRAGGDRLIEVKARGGRGPISIIERQLDTFHAAGDLAWLYVVFNVTQPYEAQLWLIQNPARLAWRQTRAATRPPGQARGVRHMAAYEISSEEVADAGVGADLGDLLDPPSWVGPLRD